MNSGLWLGSRLWLSSDISSYIFLYVRICCVSRCSGTSNCTVYFLGGIVTFHYRFPPSRTCFLPSWHERHFFGRRGGSRHCAIAAFGTSVTSAFTASSLLQYGDFFTSAKWKLFHAGFVLGRYFKICVKTDGIELKAAEPMSHFHSLTWFQLWTYYV